MAKDHWLKSWPEYFKPVLDGVKTFEIRFDDRHYSVGDLLILQEWEPNTAKFSGRVIRKRVVYKTDGIGTGAVPPLAGLYRGYCILGLGEPESGA